MKAKRTSWDVGTPRNMKIVKLLESCCVKGKLKKGKHFRASLKNDERTSMRVDTCDSTRAVILQLPVV